MPNRMLAGARRVTWLAASHRFTRPALVLVFALACARTQESPPPSDQTLLALESQWRTATCERLLECGQVAAQDSCDRFIQFSPDGSLTALAHQRFKLGRRIVLDSEKAGQCVSQTRQESCADPAAFVGASLNLKECRGTFRGTVKAGESCRRGECEPSSSCTAEAMGSDDCVGTCIRRVGAGARRTDFAECEEGLIEYNGTCYQPRAEGEQCFTQRNHRYGCGRGLFCNSSLICERQKPEGAACSDTSGCVVGLQCEHIRCRKPRLLRLGELCGTCSSLDCSLARCLPDLACNNDLHQCTPPSQEGESCHSVSCAAGLWCDAAMICRVNSAAGEPCANPFVGCDHRQPLFCDSDLICKPRKTTGEACASDLECLSLICECTSQSASFGDCNAQCKQPRTACGSVPL